MYHFWYFKWGYNNQQINTIAKNSNTECSVTLNTNGTNSSYKIDSGAQVNVIPEQQIETLQTKPRITKSTPTLSAYKGSNIPVKGKWTLDIQNCGKNVSLLFIVAGTNFPPTIGLNLSRPKSFKSDEKAATLQTPNRRRRILRNA